ncbi:hypothetical protein F4819DRAFT_8606 [Hypoxylon fuscum]|nr:hypothetical protein F4819DRAFT_8606 [Hypoxylon fuscum]
MHMRGAFGAPSLFLAFSAADLHWEDLQQHMPGHFKGEDRDQEIQHWKLILIEGLIMTYLGLYSMHHPACTFKLNHSLRQGIDLPGMSSHSLNRAWPLYQGIAEHNKIPCNICSSTFKVSSASTRIRLPKHIGRHEGKLLS